ncbi:hypothetical protein KXQ82_01355 [Mucilaginibacter sp. HMF5004]|uniref:hypothetical protein n=1 Tax=Mucilaginibacter rivuli TaxID=2857527 RepID=UPI001C5DF883|nr:hypothetical protein [Mucilaginibacter rivuli]MBW4888336.1 hypothetical protein [Mucilaginibacter rivuli]
MQQQFLTFRRFNEPALAKSLTDLLDANEIEYEVGEESLIANPLMVSGDELMREYLIKLQQHDFDKVNNLLVAEEEEALNDVEAGYYLFDFTDQELVDIVKNFDEWSAFDFALARKILKERGVVINDRHIADFKQDKIDMLKQPEERQTLGVTLGYIFSLLGGLIGVFIGWYLSTAKKTLPNGEQVYSFAEADRKHGKNIRILGIVMCVVFIALKIYLVQ